MRFMIIRRSDADSESGATPSTRLLADMGAYMGEMAAAGIVRGGEGLQPSSKGARVTFSGGTPQVLRGPFGGPGDLVAGFSIIEVPDIEEAVAWARKWPASDGGGNVTLEIRQILEAEDFGEAFTPELRDAEARMREKTEGRG